MKQTPVKGKCRWCSHKILKSDGTPDLRRTWHPLCVAEYKQTWPSNLKKVLGKRDKGFCRACNLDTETLRRSYWIGGMPLRGKKKSMLQVPNTQKAKKDGWPSPRRLWWEVDHNRPLWEADGDVRYWSLDNLQSLCFKCHKKKTVKDMTKYRESRKGKGAKKP